MIILALAAASQQAHYRMRMEASVKTVQLLLPYDELLLHVEQRGAGEITSEQALAAYGRAAVGGLLLREQTLNILKDAGELQLFSGAELLAAYRGGRATGWISTLGDGGKLQPGRLYLEIYEAALCRRLVKLLPYQTPDLVIYHEPAPGRPGVLSLAGDVSRWADAGVGFSPAELKTAAEMGFQLYLQLAGPTTGTAAGGIAEYYRSLRELPQISGVLFRDTVIPGIPGHASIIQEELAALAVPLVTIDLYERQRPALASAVRLLTPKQVLRLHTIPQEEMNLLSNQRVLQRLNLAATERNSRLLLLRFVNRNFTGEQWLERNLEFTRDLNARLQAAGLAVGEAQPYTPLPFSKIRLLLMGSGIIAAGVLLLMLLGFVAAAKLLGAAAFIALILLLSPGFYAAGFDRLETARRGLALGAALVFPLLAMILARPFFGRRPLLHVFPVFLLISGVSLVGALLISGLLGDLLYMVKLEQFAGVKLALALPPLLTWLLFLGNEGERITHVLQDRLKRPILWGSALGAAVLIALYFVYLNRTGNESLFVSELELRLRLFLDNLLPARPRTKELLIGHPLLLAAIYYGHRLRCAPLLAAAGSVGQVSLINTFAHIHTPLVVSFARTGLAMAGGLFLGLMLILLLHILERHFKLPATQENS